MQNKKPALFLDRDGVINIEKNYVHKIEDFIFIDGIFELIKTAKNRGYYIIVITNQAGIARGYYSDEDFHILNNWMLNYFQLKGAGIDKVYYCPHHPQYGRGLYKKDCSNRKPNPGMILDAVKDFNIDVRKSILIGDKQTDIDAGFNAKVGKNIFFGNPPNIDFEHNLLSVNNLQAVQDFLIGHK
tara:strand:+ start:84 stop:638 length:555 start_codon:yes stop_codon:yes gene_type:complete